MYEILGSVNYKVPFENHMSTAVNAACGTEGSHRMNNVMISSTCYLDKKQLVKHYRHFAIVFSGKLQNFGPLARKYQLNADSDMLLVMMLFELKGIKMLEDLKGTFAFALYDIGNRRLFLARDKSDNKPLYLYHKHGNFIFSSELSVLADITKTPIDYMSLARCIYLGDDYRRTTPYESIIEIEHGYYGVIDTLTGIYDHIRWDYKQRLYHGKKNILC